MKKFTTLLVALIISGYALCSGLESRSKVVIKKLEHRRSSFVVRSASPEKKVFKLTVYDDYNRVLHCDVEDSSYVYQKVINLSELPRGAYFIEIYSGESYSKFEVSRD